MPTPDPRPDGPAHAPRPEVARDLANATKNVVATNAALRPAKNATTTNAAGSAIHNASPDATSGSADTRPDADAAALTAAGAAVRRYLRFLGCDWALADDLAQEALLAAMGRFADGDAPLPWLLTAARNGYRMQLRKVGRRREVDDLDALHAQWIEVAGDDAAAARRAALRACLHELPPRSRRALELRYGEDQKRSAIARELGLGSEGVKSLLERLRAVLAACVQRRLHGGAADDAPHEAERDGTEP